MVYLSSLPDDFKSVLRWSKHILETNLNIATRKQKVESKSSANRYHHLLDSKKKSIACVARLEITP